MIDVSYILCNFSDFIFNISFSFLFLTQIRDSAFVTIVRILWIQSSQTCFSGLIELLFQLAVYLWILGNLLSAIFVLTFCWSHIILEYGKSF